MVVIFTLSCGTEIDEGAAESYPYSLFTFGGSGFDVALDITQTNDGGFVFTGSSTSSDGDFTGLLHSMEGAVVLKVSRTGAIDWIRILEGSKWNIATSVSSTMDGGVVVAGVTGSTDGIFSELEIEGENLFIAKLSVSGSVEWVRTFSGSGQQSAAEIIQTHDRGFILTGSTSSIDGDFQEKMNRSWDLFLIKLDENGETEWVRTYGGSRTDKGNGVAETATGNLIVTGYSMSDDGLFEKMNRGFQDIFLLELDKSGDIVRVNTFGGSSGDIANSVAVASDGGFVIGGTTWSVDGDFKDRTEGSLAVIKTTSSGEPEWIRTYGGSHSELISSVTVSDENMIYITGWSESQDGDFRDKNVMNDAAFFITLDASGNLEALKTFGGSGDDQGTSIITTKEGQFVISGWSDSIDGDFYLEKDNGPKQFFLIIRPDGTFLPQ